MPQQVELQQLQLDAKGLHTNPNSLAKVPPGALLQATNTVIDRDGILEQRRGINRYGTTIDLSGGFVDNFYNYQSTILFHKFRTFSKDSDGLGTWTDYIGSYGVPSGAYSVHSIQSNKNIYFTTDLGLVKLDSVSGTLKSAGVPQALDGSGTTSGASGWFTNNTQVAYRILWGYTDANSNLILSAPSQRIIVANNSGGTRNVDLTFTIPSGITTSYVYQIYRSPMSVDLNTVPTDECQLIIQTNPTAGQITAGTVTVTDSVPDSLKGATIYTAASQQGIDQSNYEPPLATDITTFKGFAFYSNVKLKQNLNVSLLAVGGTSGIVNGDTITIAGTVYTGQAAEIVASAQFQITSSSTPSDNIDQTARSLVHVINNYASNTSVYAYYISGFNDLPGAIVIKERGIGGTAFTVSVSRPSAWYLPTGTSSNSTLPGAVYISKFGQPEAVPLVNFIQVGSADKSVLRIIAIRNSVFVFKQDGVFRITGDDLTTFAETPWDNTVILRSPEAAVLLNNQIYCFTTQGIIALSETGSAIVSRPIENILLEISASQFVNFDSVTFGIGYESDRKYIMNTVSSESDVSATKSYIYNYITNTFTDWEFPYAISSGFVNPTDNKLYIASASTAAPYIYKERKSFTETDFADESFSITISSSSGTTVVVNSTTNAAIGDTLNQGIFSSMITAVTDATHLEVADIFGWTADVAIIYKPIDVTIEYVPIHAGNPTQTKIFQEVLFYFSTADFDTITLSFNSNFSQDFESLDISPLTSGIFGGPLPFGTGTFGGTFGGIQPIRTWPPLNKVRAHWLGLKMEKAQALTTFALNGISVAAKSTGYRFRTPAA